MSISKDKKDTHWFKHDLHPIDDDDIVSMIGEFGAAGYGLYWRIVEKLHNTTDNRLELDRKIYSTIAKQMQFDEEQLQANAQQMQAKAFHTKITASAVEYFISQCIKIHKLFKEEGGVFYSERVDRNMLEKRRLSDIRRSAASSKGSK